MDEPVLSVIFPCFNCASTLSEAMLSVFTQSLRIPYEVIAVNDGSTDTTQILLAELQNIYPKLRIITHNKNKGGGAARNTGIKASKGEYIFCMDSDNILEVHALQRLVDAIQLNNADGMAFSDRKYFLGKNKNIASTQVNHAGKEVALSDLFNGSSIVLDNFLYTREGYESAGGYPENHGFDTQAFEVRFLSKKLKVQICPNTLIWHRQRGVGLSYFERVFESGEYSKNMYLIYEQIFDLFSLEVRRVIINFDVFNRNSLSDNLLVELQKHYANNPATFFSSKADKKSDRDALKWSTAVKFYLDGEYSKAQELYVSLVKKMNPTPIVFWNIMRCLVNGDEQLANMCCNMLQTKKQKSILRMSLVSLLTGKIIRTVQARTSK